MQVWLIKKYMKLKLVTLSLITIANYSTINCCATNYNQQLDKDEIIVFGHTSKLSTKLRLAKLEKKIFGVVKHGSIKDRFKNLQLAIANSYNFSSKINLSNKASVKLEKEKPILARTRSLNSQPQNNNLNSNNNDTNNLAASSLNPENNNTNNLAASSLNPGNNNTNNLAASSLSPGNNDIDNLAASSLNPGNNNTNNLAASSLNPENNDTNNLAYHYSNCLCLIHLKDWYSISY